MTITITAFERSPDGGKGLARDTRVRWALEEVGQPYEVRFVSQLLRSDQPVAPCPARRGAWCACVRAVVAGKNLDR